MLWGLDFFWKCPEFRLSNLKKTVMKPIQPQDLFELGPLSLVLHLTLQSLSKSPWHLSACRLCRTFDLHPSDLTRMRLAHCRPSYARIVNKSTLRRLVLYLFNHFPGLSIQDGGDCGIQVVYHPPAGVRGTQVLAYRSIKLPAKPGTTRWFLEQERSKGPEKED